MTVDSRMRRRSFLFSGGRRTARWGRLHTNLDAALGIRSAGLSAAELGELNSAVRVIEVRGARLPEQVLVLSGVEAPPKK